MSGGFEDLGLLPELLRATAEAGWLLPSDVQDESIPLILGGGDVMVAAETGSGKTGAFALPAIQIVHETRRAAAAAAAATEAGAGGSTTPPAKKARPDSDRVQLSTTDRSPMLAVSPDGLVCQSRQEREWGGARATRGVLSGKVYYEAVMRDEGLCRVGWSTQAGSLDLGTDKHGFGYGGTGKKSNDRRFEAYGEEFKHGDVIGCYLQLDGGSGGGSIAWSKNGRFLGEAFKLPRSVGALYPAVCMKNAELSVNFGATAFQYPPANGYVGLEQAPDATTVGGSDSGSGSGGGGAAAAGGGTGGGKPAPVCIVVEPARDLAEQTAKVVEQLSKHVVSPAVRSALVIGGVDTSAILRALGRGADIIVATPLKLLDLVDSGKVSLAQVRLLVLDEADRFTDADNFALVTRLYNKVRAAIDTAAAPGRLQVCFFSATLHSPEIAKLSDMLCKQPTWVDLKGKDAVPETVHHVLVPVDPAADRSWAVRSGGSGGSAAALLDVPTDGVHARDNVSGAGAAGRPLTAEEASEGIKRLKPRMLVSVIDSLKMDQCLIFCRTNQDCDQLEAYLTAVGGGQRFRRGMEKGKENAYSCCVLAGMRSMEERRRNLDAFKEGDVRFLICTDVAARGLDIKELPYVVNMTLPDEAEQYIHRIGRVGRADRMGLAISFVGTAPQKVWYHRCSDRGRGCNNTKLTTQGGCTVWYDEPALLAAIKKRLGGAVAIPAMTVERGAGAGAGGDAPQYAFTLPAGMADGVVYGEERSGKDETPARTAALQDDVLALAALESRAQCTFLSLQLKFQAGAAGAARP